MLEHFQKLRDGLPHTLCVRCSHDPARKGKHKHGVVFRVLLNCTRQYLTVHLPPVCESPVAREWHLKAPKSM